MFKIAILLQNIQSQTLLLKFLLIFQAFFLITKFSKAQDPHFSQFYAAPLTLNPALAGTALEGRFSFNYRTQWSKLPGEFYTYQVGYDHNFLQARSGLGFSAILDRAGSAGIQSVNLQAMYSYLLPIQNNWAIKAGLQIGYGNRKLDYYELLFGDQLTEIGATGSPSAEKGLENLNVNYVEAGAGLLLYSENLLFGISGFHLNQPNQSITELTDKLPMKIVVHGAYKFIRYGYAKNKKDGYSAALTPGFYYSQQGKFKQLDIGANGFLDPLIVGLWYRGLPIQKSMNGALVVLTGFTYKGFRFLYSYDASIGRFAGITGGSHEISLSVLTGDLERAKKYQRRSKIPFFPSLTE